MIGTNIRRKNTPFSVASHRGVSRTQENIKKEWITTPFYADYWEIWGCFFVVTLARPPKRILCSRGVNRRRKKFTATISAMVREGEMK